MTDDAAMQADDADARILNSAIQIRSELQQLVPAEAQEFGAELDVHIARVRTASAAKRPEYVDGLIGIITSRQPTRYRFQQLNRVVDTYRGAPDVWAWDQTLAGETVDNNNKYKFICQTCNFENELAYIPPEDDLPECQNPDYSPRHPLKLP
jgi:hypothetical protein